MAVMERLALIIDADGQGAVRELDKVGRTADRELGRAESKSEKWSRTFTSVGTKMVAASAVIGAGLWNAAQATSDLNEAVSQTEQVFGPAADKVGEFAESAVAIGQSERSAREAANTFGLFFEKANVTNDEAADMSITMTKLASDMASFKNTSPDEAVEALGSALRGESEPIRKYGVLLDEATLKQRALDEGLIQSTKGTLPPAIKMQAAYAEILAQTGTIQGDFVRTADGAANAQRVAAAEFENAKASIGEGFLPVMQALVGTAGDVANAFAGLNDATGGFASKALAAGTVLAGVGGAAAITAGKVMELSAALKLAAANGSKFAAAMIAGMGPAAAAVAALVGAWAVWEAAMARGDREVDKLGITIENAMLKADPDKLVRMANASAAAINDMKAAQDGWNPLDHDYRRDLGEGIAKTEELLEVQNKWIAQMQDLSRETGNSEENILGWLQAQAEAGIVYEDSAAALDAYKAAVENADVAVDEATAGEIELGQKYANSREELEKLTKAVDDYFKELDGELDAQVGWEEAVDGLSAALSDNGLAWNATTNSLDITTEAGRANLAAMRESRDAAVDLGQAVLDQGGSLDEATAKTMGQVEALRQQLLAAGYSEAQVDSLVESLGLTPPDVTTAFQQPGMDAALQNTSNYKWMLDNLPRVKETILNVTSRFQGFSFGSFFDGERAAGGPVRAGGTYLVGEQGPELVTMGGNGHVTNARDTASAMGGTQVIKLVVDGKTLAEVVAPQLAKDRRAHTGSRRIG